MKFFKKSAAVSLLSVIMLTQTSVLAQEPGVKIDADEKIRQSLPISFSGIEDNESKCFFSFISRMRYIYRWGLFNNQEKEDLADHSFEVATIAHILCLIKNKKFGGDVNAEKVALMGLYHDASELITGDMPSSVKYYGDEMKPLYDKVEDKAVDEMLTLIPEEFREDYEKLLKHHSEDKELWAIVKESDILSAIIKCLREQRMNNPDFDKACDSLVEKALSLNSPEMDYFLKNFMPSFGLNIEEERFSQREAK